MKKFVLKIEYIYDNESIIPKTLSDYTVVDKSTVNDDANDIFLTLDGNILTSGNVEYKELTEKSPYFSRVPEGGRYFYTDNNHAGAGWSLYQNGYAKYEVYGSGRPIIKSVIGKLFPE